MNRKVVSSIIRRYIKLSNAEIYNLLIKRDPELKNEEYQVKALIKQLKKSKLSDKRILANIERKRQLKTLTSN